jgi:ABC-type uncharacterized transport system involved in gliding motility auxiliary subunit
MKEKKLDTLLYSTIGVAVMFVIVVAVNLIASALNTRVDLTENKVYTLSAGTKAILAKIDAPVEISFYYSQSQTRMPAQFKTYAKRVEDLLTEFRQYSRGNLEIKKLDPQPDSEAEDSANLDGIEGQMIETGEKIYLGVAISLPPQKVALPFLAPNRERLLEYDLARALSQVLSTNKPVVGVMTPLQVFGMSLPPQMRMQMGGQNQDPWVFLSELKRDFEVKQVQMDTDKIDDDIKVLLVIHPKEIKDTAQYAIDQFIMRGGKLIACLDPMSLSDVNRQNPMIPMPGGASNLEKLLKAWGIAFETTKVVADMNAARKLVVRQGGQPEIVPTLLFVTDTGISKEDVVANQIDEVLLPFSGVFTGTPASGLKQTVLLRTSKNSQLVEPFMAQMSPSKILDDFKSADTSYALAIRLEGKFKTAFPDGKPEAVKSDEDKGKDDTKDEKKPEDKAKDTIKETKTDNAVLLVGDTDWLSDQFSVAVQNFFGQKIIQPRNGNLALTQNIVEQFAGDQNLIGVRSRGTLNRPFTVVKEMQAQANARFQAEIAKLQKEADEANQKLSELQSKKEGNQRFFVSKEQQEEIEKFRKKRAEANKHLKLVRRSLAKDIESLELRTKVINIAGVPLLVAAAGIALAMVRKQKTKAQ